MGYLVVGLRCHQNLWNGLPTPIPSFQESNPLMHHAKLFMPICPTTAVPPSQFVKWRIVCSKSQNVAPPDFLEVIADVLQRVRHVLPGGDWWNVYSSEDSQAPVRLQNALRQLWELVAPDKVLIATAFFCLIVAALSEISIPHFVAASIFCAQSGMKEQFSKNVKCLAAVCCTYGIFSGLRGGCFGMANQMLVRRLREKLYAKLLSQEIAFFDGEAVGSLTSRLGSDCQQVSRIIGNDLNIIFRNGLQGLSSFIYLLTLSFPLALSTLAICCYIWSYMMVYGRYQKRASKSAQDFLASSNEVAEETLSLARIVHAFGTENYELQRYSIWSKKLMEINLRQNVAYGFWTWNSSTLYNATQVVALIIGGGFVMAGKINAEQLTKFVLYSEWVVHSTFWVGDHWAMLMQSLGASEKVFQLLDLPATKQMHSHGKQLPNLRGHIHYKNVSFRYPTRPSVPVLQKVSLVLNPGEVVAVVGLSGSGKSTLVGLLLRFYEPTKGQILIDHVPLRDLDVKWFRQQIGLVSQEPRLFSLDIASNIAYGCIDKVSASDIEAAAKQANAHEFIMSFPDGYKTMVDNARLSGGQKQRIAIARALLRNPRILILDEATSALDAESEHQVQRALDGAMKGQEGQQRTVLVIAHRLSTIRAANRIVVMHEGRITEMGTHDELLTLNGAYANLTRRQINTTS